MSNRPETRSAGRPSTAATEGNPPGNITNTVTLTQEQFRQLLEAASGNRAPVAPIANNNAPAFSLSPALVNMNAPIDFSTSEGTKLNKEAIKSLPIKFDVESRSINTFNEVLLDRCSTTGWNDHMADILTISTSTGDRNLIRDFGRITMEEVRNHCTTYINQQTRQAQHQYQMYQCLMNSLTDAGRLKIVTESPKHAIGNLKSGPLFYKFLMSKASIDSRATLSHIRENLRSLDSYMVKVSSNITKFNDYVNEQRLDLKARGGITHDLLTNLWKAYLIVSDTTFVQYIQNKQNLYDEGEDINVDKLMTQAENKYKALVLSGQWNAMTREQNQIVSLTAEVRKLKDDRVKLGFKKSGKQNKEKNKDKDNKNQSGDKGNKKKKLSNEKFKQKWAWKKKAPKPGQSTTKIFNDTKYYWCKGHKLWCLTKHDASTCKFLKDIKNVESNEAT